MNAAWHARHPMPKNASLDQRVRWHLAHAKACGCRKIPKTVIAELRARGATIPVRSSGRQATKRR
jgi:hypothetical protein